LDYEGTANGKRPVAPNDKLYNSRIIATYLKFLRKEYGSVDVNGILSHAGMEPYQIEDEGFWFTQEQVDRFHEGLLTATGRPDIAREAGRFGFSPDSIGWIRSYLLSNISIGKAYEMTAQVSSKLVKSSTYECARLSPNRVRITVTPKPGSQEKPYQCENRTGYIEACCALFHRRSPRVDHTKCFFRGDECCEYIVTWQDSKPARLRRARNIASLAFALVCASLAFSASLDAFLVCLVLWLAVAFGLSSIASSIEHRMSASKLDSQKRAIDDLVKKKEAGQNNSKMHEEISRILETQTDIPDVLRESVSILDKRLDYDRGIIFLADMEKNLLEVKETFGFSRSHLELLASKPLYLEKSGQLPVRCFRERKAFLFDRSKEPDSSGVDPAVRDALDIKASICCPILCAGEAIGVLAVDDTSMKHELLQSDMDQLMLVGQQIGVAIQNLRLKETEKALRESEALFRAVVEKSSEIFMLTDMEGRISYVSPHVTDNLGYAPSDVVGAKTAMFVHPDESNIAAEAMSWVRRHPGKSRDITVRVRHVDGSWRWFEIIMRDLLSERGVGAIVSNLRDVTGKKKAQEALEESEGKFKGLVEKAIVGVHVVQDDVFEYVNAKCAAIHGYVNPEEMVGLKVEGVVLPDDLPLVYEAKKRLDEEGENQGLTYRIVRKDGQIRYIETYGRRTKYRRKPAIIGMTVDITDRRNAENALLWKTTFLEALVDSSLDGILVLDNHTQKVAQNQRLVDMWKMPPHIVETTDEERRINFILASIKNPEEFYGKLMHLYGHPGDTIRCQFELKDGTWVEAFSYPVVDKEDVSQYGRIWMFRDITKLKCYWDMVKCLSTTDGLTGISNRRAFDEFMEREWRRSTRGHSAISLLLIDIDFFKQFNDRYGHLVGDECLRRVGAVLGRCVRRAGDLVARYGGEEFACVLTGMTEEQAMIVASGITAEVSSLGIPIEGSGEVGHVTVSIGAATKAPQRGQEYQDLVKMADRALYAAKQQGRNRVVMSSEVGTHEERRDKQSREAARARG
jgi:diguanylate cyclase (GGDEF)-like protein/PAS domain S-box-containing protein